MRVDLVERLPVLIAERDVKVLTLLVVQFAVFVVVAAIKEFLDLFFVVDCRVETKLESWFYCLFVEIGFYGFTPVHVKLFASVERLEKVNRWEQMMVTARESPLQCTNEEINFRFDVGRIRKLLNNQVEDLEKSCAQKLL